MAAETGDRAAVLVGAGLSGGAEPTDGLQTTNARRGCMAVLVQRINAGSSLWALLCYPKTCATRTILLSSCDRTEPTSMLTALSLGP